jgi:hypothetical protein
MDVPSADGEVGQGRPSRSVGVVGYRQAALSIVSIKMNAVSMPFLGNAKVWLGVDSVEIGRFFSSYTVVKEFRS